MKIVRVKITRAELKTMAEGQFGELVKAVVDVGRNIMAIGGELHSDGEALLLEDGSRQEALWGINIYPNKTGDDRIEFDSMVNLRPSFGNRTRSVDDPMMREKIKQVVNSLVER